MDKNAKKYASGGLIVLLLVGLFVYYPSTPPQTFFVETSELGLVSLTEGASSSSLVQQSFLFNSPVGVVPAGQIMTIYFEVRGDTKADSALLTVMDASGRMVHQFNFIGFIRGTGIQSLSTTFNAPTKLGVYTMRYEIVDSQENVLQQDKRTFTVGEPKGCSSFKPECSGDFKSEGRDAVRHGTLLAKSCTSLANPSDPDCSKIVTVKQYKIVCDMGTFYSTGGLPYGYAFRDLAKLEKCVGKTEVKQAVDTSGSTPTKTVIKKSTAQTTPTTATPSSNPTTPTTPAKKEVTAGTANGGLTDTGYNLAIAAGVIMAIIGGIVAFGKQRK